MSKITYYTQEGYDELHNRINRMKTKDRPALSKAISDARDKGDLSENAEYHAAKEELGILETKILMLENELATARVIDESIMDNSKVAILSKVKVKNLKFNKEFEYRLVSKSETNLKEGKISIESPIGKGLLGKKVGEIAQCETPGGIMEFEILDISR